MKKPTIRDVAAEAGVSVATVSRVLNDKPDASGESRRKVEDAVRKLGYARSSQWEQITTGKSRVISLHFPNAEAGAGQVYGLVGANGAGKTTLVKLLARLYDPDAGRITYDGVDLRDLDPASLHKRIGVIFQDFVHYFLSARENIGFGQVEALDDLARIQTAAEKGGGSIRTRWFPRMRRWPLKSQPFSCENHDH